VHKSSKRIAASEFPPRNLYTNCILALDIDTGKLRWYFQFTPHDVHDWDATEPPVLVNARFHGRERKLLLHADRNGFFYVLDRTNGEFLLAKPFVKKLTWASGIGPDGRPQLTVGAEPTRQGTKESLPRCPRRHQLVFSGLQSGYRPLLRDDGGRLLHLPAGARRRIHPIYRLVRPGREISPRPRHRDGQDRLGDSADRTDGIELLGRPFHFWRLSLLRRGWRRLRGGGRQDRPRSLAFRSQPALESFADDVHGEWAAVRGDCVRRQCLLLSLWMASEVVAA
jgi:hypothetical protein